AGIIKLYGHPRVVAARYGSAQYLIGPDLLPFYWSTLSVATSIVIGFELIVGAISALASHNGVRFFDAMSAAWNSLIWIFGIVTVVFALLERAPQRKGERPNLPFMRWDPRRLPPASVHAPVRRSSAIAEFIANFIALLVLLDAGGAHHVPLDSLLAGAMQQMHVGLTPAWSGAYIGTIAGTALIAVSAIAVFLVPRLTLLHEFVRIVASICVIAGLGVTLRAGTLLQGATERINTAVSYALICAIVILGAQIAVSLRAMLRSGVDRRHAISYD
ncbi:MAG: hypothetical protein JO165_01430, partial [Candidatus Eremiobacteraeota bacterium]|nr:hypothetical protein [Candidatus Eremiobacteraeota bacterium]